MEELLESTHAVKDTQTSYQLTPQRQVFLPPAAETRQLSPGAVLGQGVSQGQRPQHKALLPLLAELQLTQPGQTRLQALLGPTALHRHRERERTLHSPLNPRLVLITVKVIIPLIFYFVFSNWPRFTRAFAGYKEPCCIPFLVVVWLPWSGMVSQTIYALYIFYFAAVKRRHGAPPSATSHGEESGSHPRLSQIQSQPSLDARGWWVAARNVVPSPLIHYSEASTSPIFPSWPGTNGLLQGTAISGPIVKHWAFIILKRFKATMLQ